MVGQITAHLAARGVNVADWLHESRGELAYARVDVDSEVVPELPRAIAALPGRLAACSIVELVW